MDNNTTVKEKEETVVSAVASMPTVNMNTANIVPINYETALAEYPEDVKQEIINLSNAIDVTQLEKLMAYGQAPLLRSFEEAGEILKSEEGSTADQAVIEQVKNLAKKANESYEDFNLALKEPNFIEKLLLKISKSRNNKRNEEIKTKAITNYRLLVDLRDSCESWLEMLKEAMTQITFASSGDKVNVSELEKYLVAGYIAKERIGKELEEAKQKYELSYVQEAEDRYNALKEGAEIFDIVLLNLEKSRAAFKISIGQLMLDEKTNKNLQIAIRTQKTNTMALTAQQLRNAILDQKNKEVLEAQKSISKLNDELMKMVATNSVVTAEESVKVLFNGVYTVESALVAGKTIIDGCNAIVKSWEANAGKVTQDIDKLKTIVNELEPHINKVKGIETKSTSNVTSTTTPTNNGGLVF